jgi:hypothetical protein
MAERGPDLGDLAIFYVHIFFTVLRGLAPLALHNKRIFYQLLFRTTTENCARRPLHSSFPYPAWLQCRCIEPVKRDLVPKKHLLPLAAKGILQSYRSRALKNWELQFMPTGV